MIKDDIIKLAREAELHLYVNDLTEEPYALVVERFANLVAAHEREACAELCDGLDDALVDGLAGWQYGEAIRARGTP